MTKPVVDSVTDLIEGLFAYDIGSSQFNIVVGVCVLTWILVARVLMGMFSSQRGIVAAASAFVLTLLIGLVAYAMTEIHAVPLVDIEWVAEWLPLAGLVLFIFLSVLVIAKRIMDVNGPLAVFIFVLASAASVGAYFAVQITMGVVEAGEGKVEERDNRVNRQLDSIL